MRQGIPQTIEVLSAATDFDERWQSETILALARLASSCGAEGSDSPTAASLEQPTKTDGD